MTTSQQPHFLHFLGAFGAGGILTLMILFNGTLGAYGSLLFSSWVPHLTGTVLALAILLARRRPRPARRPAPLWAYFGGLAGGITVIVTSATVNSALALSGTIALGLAGQIVFSLICDKWGLFGMPKRLPGWRDFAGIGLIAAGAFVLIFYGGVI